MTNIQQTKSVGIDELKNHLAKQKESKNIESKNIFSFIGNNLVYLFLVFGYISIPAILAMALLISSEKLRYNVLNASDIISVIYLLSLYVVCALIPMIVFYSIRNLSLKIVQSKKKK